MSVVRFVCLLVVPGVVALSGDLSGYRRPPNSPRGPEEGQPWGCKWLISVREPIMHNGQMICINRGFNISLDDSESCIQHTTGEYTAHHR